MTARKDGFLRENDSYMFIKLLLQSSVYEHSKVPPN